MKKSTSYVFILVLIFLLPYHIVGDEGIQEVFSINLLSPNTSAARNQWSLLMENQLPKIGIGIDFHESTGWGNIAPRTWSYPLIDFDYVPTYAEGGYDILFYNHDWDFDWDPTSHYSSGGIVPYGENFYQYSNPAFDFYLHQYLTEFNQTTQIGYAKQMQAMLYDDLPSVAVFYPSLLYGIKEELLGIDFQLLSSTQHCLEKWNDSEDNIIKYGIPVDLKEYNLFKQISYFDNLWMQPVYGSLFQREQDTHIWKHSIARNLSVSSDSKNFTITLDPNAKFSDGDPVLADDIKYSYELQMSPLVRTFNYALLTNCFSSNDSIEVINNSKLNFNFSQPYSFPYNILSMGIVDKSEVEPKLASYGYSIFDEIPLTGNVNDSLVKSCGPFMLNSYYNLNSSVQLIPNPFWKDLNSSEGIQPYLDEFHLNFISGKDTAVAELISGNIDIVDTNYYPVISDFVPAGVECVLEASRMVEMMGINMKHPILGTGELTPLGTSSASKYIRKAISYMIPRDLIVDQILEGLGTSGVTPCPIGSDCFDITLEPYVYDINIAGDCMEYAGFSMYEGIFTIEGIEIDLQKPTVMIVCLSSLFALIGTSILLILKLNKLL